jgi:hypothetical protein
MQKLANVMDVVVEDLQIQEVLGEGLKIMQEDFVCHYFVDLEGTRVGGPMLIKDDALGLASSGD